MPPKETPARKINLLSLRLKVVNIHQGSNGREEIVYGELRDADSNELLISATLDYITNAINAAAKERA
jgi:hypothetical protein